MSDPRAALLDRVVGTEPWDVIVVGGGASGLGCALDAVSRGLTTLLLEGRDFAAGTSSRSTKLIHGGVRYLAQGRLHLVRDALIERARLLENAPHTVHRLRCVVPCESRIEQLYYAAGLTAYDLLAGAQGIGRTALLNREQTRAALPNLARPSLGVAYLDGQFDDAALALSLMRTFVDLGGVAINYCPVQGLLHDAGRLSGVIARDAETGRELRLAARTVINACGVWGDRLRQMDDPAAVKLMRPSQGIHLVLDQKFIGGQDALLIPKTPDGRLLFVIPWQGKALVGTTDTPVDEVSDEPRAQAREIDFVLETAGRYLARVPQRSDILSVFAGLRPLVAEPGKGAMRSSRLSREHVIEVAHSGLITLAGGKWTTYRQMAEDTVDRVIEQQGLVYRPAQTAGLRLLAPDPLNAQESTVPISASVDLTEAAVRHAVRSELARTVEDVLSRRHRALLLDAAAAADAALPVARLIAAELGHDEAWVTAQVAQFFALAQQYRVT